MMAEDQFDEKQTSGHANIFQKDNPSVADRRLERM